MNAHRISAIHPKHRVAPRTVQPFPPTPVTWTQLTVFDLMDPRFPPLRNRVNRDVRRRVTDLEVGATEYVFVSAVLALGNGSFGLNPNATISTEPFYGGVAIHHSAEGFSVDATALRGPGANRWTLPAAAMA